MPPRLPNASRELSAPGGAIEAADVRVKVVLNLVATSTHVDVERYWRLEETCVVRKELAAAFTQEIPAEANARLRVADEVVQGQVGSATKRVSLLEVPTQTEIDLKVTSRSPIFLNVEALSSRGGEFTSRY